MKVKVASKLQCSDLLLDQRNLELLRLLRADTRMSLSELARRIGMSAPAVRERIARLEEGGVIQGSRDPRFSVSQRRAIRVDRTKIR